MLDTDKDGRGLFANCRFYVEIDKKTEAVFTEVGGLTIETTIQDYEEGGNNGIVHRLPGRTKIGNLVLKRGLTVGKEFLRWYIQITSGQIVKKTVSLKIFSPKELDVIAEWHVLGAFPVKWVGPQLVADGAVVPIETLELAHAGITLAK
jgi:phage tail-like protein